MSVQTITYTSFENVPNRTNRLHMTSMQAYTGFPYIIATLYGSQGLEWAFEGYDSNGTMIVDIGWLPNGYNLDLSQTYRIDEVTEWEIWLRFSENYDISPSDVSSVECEYEVEDPSGWYVDAHGIQNHEFSDDVPYMEKPFPVSIWQCDPAIDSGIAYVPLFPDAVALEPIPVPQIPYIMVYGIQTPQSTLAMQNNNGLAILTPTVCEEEEELCGAWTINMEHPIDPEGRWKLLQEGNILRAGGQLFTIKYTEEVWQGNSGKIVANAEHIFYQFADNWIFANPANRVSIVSYTGTDFFRQMESHLTDKIVIPGGQSYAYTWNSNLRFDNNPYILRLEEGRNPVDLILGEDGLISAKGGELHRDNFYYSVKTRKEGASDNGFDLRIGKNMTGIKRTVDTSSLCTYYRLYESNSGQYVDWMWVTDGTGTYWTNFLPHHVVRSESVSYPPNIKGYMDELQQEAYERFQKICKPYICYEIDLEDVRQNPDFEIVSAESLRCGDIGTVYDEHLGGTLKLEITGTTYDRITGKCKKIIIGQKQSFVYHPNTPIIWNADGEPIEPEISGYKIWVQDSTGRFLKDSTGRKIVINSPTT